MSRSWSCLAVLAGMPVALGTPWLPHALAAAPMPAADTEIRVLLQEATLVAVESLRGQLQLRDGLGRPLLVLPPGQGLSVRADPAQSQIRLDGPGTESLPASALGRELWLEVIDAEAAATGVEGLAAVDAAGVLVLQKRPYRGRLQLRLEGGRLQVINHLDLEAYLASVVGSEMPASWPQQALRAQAVAARTYALKQRRPAEPFDLRATVTSQVYRGIDAETASTREAVASTRSEVLTYDDELILAVFHSSSGLATEDSGAVWSRQLPYLVSVPDFDRSSPVSAWSQRFSAAQLNQLFPETGGVSRFEVMAVSPNGRLRQVRVEGPRGQRLYSGADLRRILGLRSTHVRFEPLDAAEAPPGGAASAPELLRTTAGRAAASLPVAPGQGGVGPVPSTLGALPPLPPLPGSGPAGAPALQPPSGWLLRGRGFGHGVGMSQWGAFGLASQGMDYVRILQHYYRGTSLITLPGPMQAAAGRRTVAASGSSLGVAIP